MEINTKVLNKWLQIVIRAAKNTDVSDHVTNVNERFYKLSKFVISLLMKKSYRVAEIDDYFRAFANNYTYKLDGEEFNLSVKQVFVAFAMFCKLKGLVWDQSNAPSVYEVDAFKGSNFGKLLIKHGLFTGSDSNAQPEETTQEPEQTTEPTNVAQEPTTDTAEAEPAQEPAAEPEPTQASEVQPEEQPTEAQPAEGEAKPKRKRRKRVKDGDHYYGNQSDDVKRSRAKDKDRKKPDRSFYPHMSPYVIDLIGTPGSPIEMTGSGGYIYIIAGKANNTSNKTPKAYVMPLKKQLLNTRTGEIGDINPKKLQPNTDRLNDKGELKVHIAGSSTLQNQMLFFNTPQEAQHVLDQVLANPEGRIDTNNIVVSDLKIKAIKLFEVDPNWRRNLEVFTRKFYKIKTEFGEAYIAAKDLFESMQESVVDEDGIETWSDEYGKAYDEAFRRYY